MTEADWLHGAKPHAMLQFLNGKASDRQFVLFACACCRRVWPLLTEPALREAVEALEEFIDGRGPDPGEMCFFGAGNALMAVNERRRQAVHMLARAKWWGWLVPARQREADGTLKSSEQQAFVALMAFRTAFRWPAYSAHEAIDDSSELMKPAGVAEMAADHVLRLAASKNVETEEDTFQRNLLRCIFGNPFRQPLPIEPAWLTWNDGTAAKLARAIYEERRFAELPVLADALQDAGCADDRILAHCRAPGPHARGCWVVDALLQHS